MAPPPKRRKVEPVAELTFDPDARQEYLTGFHRRKQQRIKHAKDTAIKRDKEERVRNRREIRDQRKQDLERHVAEVNALLKKQADPSDGEDDDSDAEEVDDEWAGFDDALTTGGTDEYIDEGKFTTVTVKELDDIRDFESASEDEDAAPNGEAHGSGKSEEKERKRKRSDKPKKKKKKFRYESPLERQQARKKQKAKNAAAAKARRAG